MPRKKKSHLSQYSKSAIRMRLVRSQESKEVREAKLAASRENIARLRASETSAERESRLSLCRSQMRSSRIRENSKQREARLRADREAHRLCRDSESLVHKQTRLSSQRVRTAKARARETPEQREARRIADREASILSRGLESCTDREKRLSSQRLRSWRSRQLETSPQREARLRADRERNNRARILEREDAIRQKLLMVGENYDVTRQNEENDLLVESERVREIRQEEMAEEYRERLNADRLRHVLSIMASSSIEDSKSWAETYILPCE